MEKEYVAGELQLYQIGNRVFIVEPYYNKNGESMEDILLKLMMADIEQKLWKKCSHANQTPFHPKIRSCGRDLRELPKYRRGTRRSAGTNSMQTHRFRYFEPPPTRLLHVFVMTVGRQILAEHIIEICV